MNNWQPIETAPRDGTPILMLLESLVVHDVFLGSPPCMRAVIGDFSGPGNVIYSPSGDCATVTHWIPIPPPPDDK